MLPLVILLFLSIPCFVHGHPFSWVRPSEVDLYVTALVQAAKKNTNALQATGALIGKDNPESLKSGDNFASIQDYYDHVFVTMVASSPQLLSALGIFESVGMREHNNYLDNVSPQAIIENTHEMQRCLGLLDRYDLSQLTHDQKISYKILKWLRHDVQMGEKFLFHPYRVTQLFGILFELQLTFTQYHLLNTSDDVQTYITRLSKIPEQLQQLVQLLDYQKERGIIAPRCALQKVVDSLHKMVAAPVTEHPLYTHLAQHSTKIDMENKDNALTQARVCLESSVIPAYTQVLGYCRTLLEIAPHNHGVWSLPDGDAYYAYILSNYTTIDVSPDQVHALGLAEVERIQQQIRDVLAEDSRYDPCKSVGELLNEFSYQSRFYFEESATGRQKCMEKFNAIIKRSHRYFAHLFDLKPNSCVVIQAVPKNEESGQSGAYYLPPDFPGARPGIFFINLRSMKEIPIYRMETLAVHEVEPGHHFQLALQYELNLPLFQKLGEYTAYVEGWALYAEKLAYEEGFYSSIYSQVGHLQDELLRAIRLVVDTGLHKKRWSREQAIDYMQTTLGWRHESVVTEVERYLVMPGQACAYKIGQCTLLELRQRVRTKFKKKFDIKKFHNVILSRGAMPLTVLNDVIEDYISMRGL